MHYCNVRIVPKEHYPMGLYILKVLGQNGFLLVSDSMQANAFITVAE